MRRRWPWVAAGAVLLLAVGGWYWFHHLNASSTQVGTPGASGAPGGGNGREQRAGAESSGGKRPSRPGGPGGMFGGEQVVPVTVQAVGKHDMPVYLDGIGTVQASATVTVTPQVTGVLESLGFTEGQAVKKGQILAQIDPRPYQADLAQAEGQLGEARAQLDTAQSDLKRYDGLLDQGYVTHQEVDTQKQTVAQMQATVKAAEAAVENARLSLAYATIRSPMDGIAGIRQMDVGNLAQASSSTIVVITTIEPVDVLFTLASQVLPQIQQAGTLQLPVLALEQGDSKQLAQGTLTVVDNQIDTTTGTFKLKARFDNPSHSLWPGQFVNVRLQVSTRKGVLTVPAQTVQRGPDGDYVFVANADDTASQRTVTVTESDDNQMIVESGLKEGEKVIIDGQFRLRDGARIQLADPQSPQQPATGDQQARREHHAQHASDNKAS